MNESIAADRKKKNVLKQILFVEFIDFLTRSRGNQKVFHKSIWKLNIKRFIMISLSDIWGAASASAHGYLLMRQMVEVRENMAMLGK